MKGVVIFSKYAAYSVGGAEKSIFEYVKQIAAESVRIVSFLNVRGYGAKSRKKEFPANWCTEFIDKTYDIPRFPYIEYLLNRNRVKNYVSQMDGKEDLLTYSFYAAVAALSYKGKVTVFIRSETDLGINNNYHRGFKRILKGVHTLIQYPGYYLYRKDLAKSLAESSVVCNSRFMAGRLLELFGVNGKVVYPHIDTDALIREYKSGKSENKGIVFIGDSYLKGLPLVLCLARSLPKHHFFIYSRKYQKKSVVRNISWMPWSNSPGKIYQNAKLVIVPSLWQEAYGRVAREAYILGLPVLVSNIGGLPETVEGNKECIINRYHSVDVWKSRIKEKFDEFA